MTIGEKLKPYIENQLIDRDNSVPFPKDLKLELISVSLTTRGQEIYYAGERIGVIKRTYEQITDPNRMPVLLKTEFILDKK